MLLAIFLFSVNHVFAACSDSDSKNYFIKGKVLSENIEIEDSCIDNNLREYYCKNNNIIYTEIFCGYGCKNGACITSESDTKNQKGFLNNLLIPIRSFFEYLGIITQACMPNCNGKTCGNDGCGGSCGNCDLGQTCNFPTGQCIAMSCTPEICNDNNLCTIDGCDLETQSCEHSLKFCPAGQTCNPSTGQCIGVCIPNCDGKTCGNDGCGGSCGNCDLGQTCTNGVCVSTCSQSNCNDNNLCTNDICINSGLGYICQHPPVDCPAGQTCNPLTGQCIAMACTPEICNDNNLCTIDGCDLETQSCEHSLKFCPAGQTCNPSTGQCTAMACTPEICNDNNLCTIDGCDLETQSCEHSLKFCPAGQTCNPSTGQCTSINKCQGKICNDNNLCTNDWCNLDTGNCKYSLKSCPAGQTCNPSTGQCVCIPNCDGKICGDDGCGGSCGTCPAGQTCNVNDCENLFTCTDSDISNDYADGKNPQVIGTASGVLYPEKLDIKNWKQYTDECILENNTLKEYFCSWQYVDSKIIECKTPCKNGVCVDINCAPKKCEQKKIACGITEDGCGKEIDCGNCTSNDICAKGECQFNGQCEYSMIPGCCKIDSECISDDKCKTGKCIDNRCQYIDLNFFNNFIVNFLGCFGKQCGYDICGKSCGNCTEGLICNSNGKCVPNGNCSDSDNGINYLIFGTVKDITGKIFSDACINSTHLNETFCNSSGYADFNVTKCSVQCQNGICSCTPKTCSQLGKTCGNWDNGCGTNLNCGSCLNGTCNNGTCINFQENFSIEWIKPNDTFISMKQNQFTKIAFKVCCLKDNCTDAKVKLFYKDNQEDNLVSTIKGDMPFYVNSSNPFEIPLMNKNECQNIIFWVNATGEKGKGYNFFGEVNPKTSNIGAYITESAGQCIPNELIMKACCPGTPESGCIKCNPETLKQEYVPNGEPCYNLDLKYFPFGYQGKYNGVCWNGMCLPGDMLTGTGTPTISETCFERPDGCYSLNFPPIIPPDEEPIPIQYPECYVGGQQDQPNDNTGLGGCRIDSNINPPSSCCCSSDMTPAENSIETAKSCSGDWVIYTESDFYPVCKFCNDGICNVGTMPGVPNPCCSNQPLEFPVGYNWWNNPAYPEKKVFWPLNYNQMFPSCGGAGNGKFFNCEVEWRDVIMNGVKTKQVQMYQKCRYIMLVGYDEINYYGTDVQCCPGGTYSYEIPKQVFNCMPSAPVYNSATDSFEDSSTSGCGGVAQQSQEKVSITACLPEPIVKYDISTSSDEYIIPMTDIFEKITEKNNNPAFSCDSNNCEEAFSVCKLSKDKKTAEWEDQCVSKCTKFQTCDGQGNCIDECENNDDCPPDKPACLDVNNDKINPETNKDDIFPFLERPELSIGGRRCVDNFCKYDVDCLGGKICSMTYNGPTVGAGWSTSGLYKLGNEQYGECIDAECNLDAQCGVDKNGEKRICGYRNGIKKMDNPFLPFLNHIIKDINGNIIFQFNEPEESPYGAVLIFNNNWWTLTNICSDNICDGNPVFEIMQDCQQFPGAPNPEICKEFKHYSSENIGKKFCPGDKTCENGKCVDTEAECEFVCEFGQGICHNGICKECKNDANCKLFDENGKEKCPKLLCKEGKCVPDDSETASGSCIDSNGAQINCGGITYFKDCAKTEQKLLNKDGIEVCVADCPKDKTISPIGDFCVDEIKTEFPVFKYPEKDEDKVENDMVKVAKKSFELKTGDCGKATLADGSTYDIPCSTIAPGSLEITNLIKAFTCLTEAFKSGCVSDGRANEGISPDRRCGACAPEYECNGDNLIIYNPECTSNGCVRTENTITQQSCIELKGICYTCKTSPAGASCAPKESGEEIPKESIENEDLAGILSSKCTEGYGLCKSEEGTFVCDGEGGIKCSKEADVSKNTIEIPCNRIDENCDGIIDNPTDEYLESIPCSGSYCPLIDEEDILEKYCFFDFDENGDIQFECPNYEELQEQEGCTAGCGEGTSGCCATEEDESLILDINEYNFDYLIDEEEAV